MLSNQQSMQNFAGPQSRFDSPRKSLDGMVIYEIHTTPVMTRPTVKYTSWNTWEFMPRGSFY